MVEKDQRSPFTVHALMVLVIALVATSFPVGKAITQGLPPDVLMMLRFFLAALLFAPYVVVKYGVKLPKATSLFGYGLLSIPLVLFFWCMFEALRYTTAVNTGAFYTLVPALTAFFAFFINNERLRAYRLLGLSLGTAGALWIVFRGNLSAMLALKLNYGDVVFVVGVLCMSLYSALIKRVYAGEPMVVMTFWVILIGGVLLFFVSGNALLTIHWLDVDAYVYLGVLYLAVFTTLVTFFLIQFGTVRLGATKVASYSFLTPIFVLIITAMIGSNTLELNYLPGILMVLIAMRLIQIDSEPIQST